MRSYFLDKVLLQELAGMGWWAKRIAGEYTARTGQYVSHSTVRDRLAGMSQRTYIQPALGQ